MIKDTSNNCFEEIIWVIVKPNSDKNLIIGVEQNKIKIKIACPAKEDKANEELIKFLSESIKIPKKNIKIVSGKKSNIKKILIKKKTKESILKILLSSI